MPQRRAFPGNPNAGYTYAPGYGGQSNLQLANNPNGQYTEDWYTYSVNILSLAGLATSIQQVIVQADSDFDLIETTCSANLNGDTEPWTDASIIPITVLITDGGSGRQLQSIPVPITGIAGTGKQPFILPIPRKFMAKSTITLSFTNYSNNEYDNIFFNLIGRKIFKLG